MFLCPALGRVFCGNGFCVGTDVISMMSHNSRSLASSSVFTVGHTQRRVYPVYLKKVACCYVCLLLCASACDQICTLEMETPKTSLLFHSWANL